MMKSANVHDRERIDECGKDGDDGKDDFYESKYNPFLIHHSECLKVAETIVSDYSLLCA